MEGIEGVVERAQGRKSRQGLCLKHGVLFLGRSEGGQQGSELLVEELLEQGEGEGTGFGGKHAINVILLSIIRLRRGFLGARKLVG